MGTRGDLEALRAGTRLPRPASSPASRTPPRRVRHNLPAQPSPLIGRERETGALRSLLLNEGVRLVTLTGPGGCGKTRLALAAAESVLDAFPHGVWFVDLAPVVHAELVLGAIAEALGLREVPDQPFAERVRDHVRDRRHLLVLDNFEHLLAAATEVSELLEGSWHLKILVTSRESLRLRWEHVFPVSPLEVPKAMDLRALERLERAAAVRLYVERARARQPAFTLTADNARAVAELCIRLDGLPLAIELAASYSEIYRPSEILAGVREGGLSALKGGPVDLPRRQRGLRAAIGWSYALLAKQEQRFFARLGVFSGGWTVDAAVAVAERPPATGNAPPVGQTAFSATFQALDSLVRKSLVQRQEVCSDEPRFQMLETVREYALERLAATRELHQARQRHAQYFLNLAELARSEMFSPGQAAALNRIDCDLDNFRAALSWAVSEEAGDPTLGLRLVWALGPFWYTRGSLTEGRRWVDLALARGRWAAPSLRGRGLQARSALALRQGHAALALAAATESARLLASSEDQRELGIVLGVASMAAQALGDLSGADAYAAKALALHRTLDDRWGIGNSLIVQARTALLRRKVARAQTLAEEGLAALRAAGERHGIVAALDVLAEVAREQGRAAEATALCEEGLRLRGEIDDHQGCAALLRTLAETAYLDGQLARAQRRYVESLRLSREADDLAGLMDCLMGLATVLVACGEMNSAAHLFGAWEALRNEEVEVHASLPPRRQRDFERSVARARAALGRARLTRARAEGRAMMLDEAVAYALLTEQGRASARSLSEQGSRMLLTRREQEVAALVARGLTNRQIAQRLVIAEGTAERHLANIARKLGFSSRTQVAVWAVESGLLLEGSDR